MDTIDTREDPKARADLRRLIASEWRRQRTKTLARLIALVVLAFVVGYLIPLLPDIL